MRRLWCAMVKKQFGDAPGLEGLAELDVNIGYLRKPEQVHFWYICQRPIKSLNWFPYLGSPGDRP